MRISLRLYITSSSPQSMEALADIEKIQKENSKEKVEVEVVDVLENPSQAERDQISVTPTLIVLSPLPSRKIVGSFKGLDKELGLSRSA